MARSTEGTQGVVGNMAGIGLKGVCEDPFTIEAGVGQPRSHAPKPELRETEHDLPPIFHVSDLSSPTYGLPFESSSTLLVHFSPTCFS